MAKTIGTYVAILDHSDAAHVVRTGAKELELGSDATDRPQAGDRLVLGSDGLTNHITEDDLRDGSRRFTDHYVRRGAAYVREGEGESLMLTC